MTPADFEESPHIGPDHQLPEHASGSGSSKTVKVIVWIAIFLIFGLAFYLIEHHKTVPTTPAGGGGRRGGGAAGGTVVLTTATATEGDIGVYVDAIGTVTPVYTANITAQVSGPVTAVHFKEGQLVRKGTPLIEIDSRPYRATLLQAQGTLERDQATLAKDEMDAERYRQAWAKNAIPKQTLDDQEKLVMTDKGTVKIDEGVVQYDQIQVDYCHIVSPITGRVGLRLVDPGNIVTANGTTTLAVVTQIQPITVIFAIPEDSLNLVQPQLQHNAKLEVDAVDRDNTTKLATGTLLTLDNQIDTTTGTVKARAQFSNSDTKLYPNEFVNADLLANTLHNQTLVPTSTIQHNGTAAYVYVIQDNVAHLKNVQTGVSDKGNTAVTGINPGDVLANSSFEKLQEGAKTQLQGAGGGKGSGGKGGKQGGKASSGSGSPSAGGTASGSTAP
jgi:multidrug efflux system membrane fusion protein